MIKLYDVLANTRHDQEVSIISMTEGHLYSGKLDKFKKNEVKDAEVHCLYTDENFLVIHVSE